MNLYEKLVYLATKPLNDETILSNRNGDALNSSTDILNELKKEFQLNLFSNQLIIDMRQACETKVVTDYFGGTFE